MENLTHFPHIILSFLAILTTLIAPINGQSSNSLCTGAMLRSFSPCINFLTSGANISSPSSGCCSSLKELMSNGQDCLCLIATGGVPLQVPINRNLAISLPRACRMSGVPVECKATASPVPAPAQDPRNPSQSGPALSPPNPTVPFVPQPLTPPSPQGSGLNPPDGDTVPTLTPPGMRPTLTPSAAESAHSILPSVLVVVLGVILLKGY